jgi:hypothetical protein
VRPASTPLRLSIAGNGVAAVSHATVCRRSSALHPAPFSTLLCSPRREEPLGGGAVARGLAADEMRPAERLPRLCEADEWGSVGPGIQLPVSVVHQIWVQVAFLI